MTNNSLANRTLLFDLARNDWSEPLLAWSGLERRILGRVVPGGTVVGTVSDDMAARLGLPTGVRIVAGGHDQCCNALGCGAIEAGKAVCGIGTYECITPTFAPVQQPLAMLAEGLNIEHHVLPGLYVSFLYNQAGSLVKWFRDTFAAAEAARGDADLYARLNAEMPDEPTELLVLPHFDPPQWPRYLPDTAGAIVGLHTSTTRGEILKAIMECTTLYFVDGIHGLRRLGIDLTECIASGGGARSDAWLQLKADIFNLPFVRTRITRRRPGGSRHAGRPGHRRLCLTARGRADLRATRARLRTRPAPACPLPGKTRALSPALSGAGRVARRQEIATYLISYLISYLIFV